MNNETEKPTLEINQDAKYCLSYLDAENICIKEKEAGGRIIAVFPATQQGKNKAMSELSRINCKISLTKRRK